MKKINLVLIFLLFFSAVEAQKNGINFHADMSWSQILAKAKAEKKYIFLDCYATWCGPCKNMDNQVYPNESLGQVFNQKYISVKVQMDKSVKDNAQIKSWYDDAQVIAEKYKIIAYPTLLILDFDGSVMSKALGFQTVEELIRLSVQAQDPGRFKYEKDMLAYRLGNKNYLAVPGMINITRNVIGDEKLATSLAEDFKSNYLEKLSLDDFLTKENLDFVKQNALLIQFGDPTFKILNSNSARLQSIDSDFSLTPILSKLIFDEFDRLVYKRTDSTNQSWRPIFQNPNWKAVKFRLCQDFASRNVDEVFNQAVEIFYERTQNWKKYALWVNKNYQRSLEPGIEFFEDAFNLNAHAWKVFIHNNDSRSLKLALSWTDRLLKHIGVQADGLSFLHYVLDTRANLLYKLGKSREAIATELQAIRIKTEYAIKAKEAIDVSSYNQVLEQMRMGKPTYVESEGAVWKSNK